MHKSTSAFNSKLVPESAAANPTILARITHDLIINFPVFASIRLDKSKGRKALVDRFKNVTDTLTDISAKFRRDPSPSLASFRISNARPSTNCRALMGLINGPASNTHDVGASSHVITRTWTEYRRESHPSYRRFIESAPDPPRLSASRRNKFNLRRPLRRSRAFFGPIKMHVGFDRWNVNIITG